jgi:hypothetical protein
MHQIQGEDLDTADNSREGTDYCSTNGKATDTEEQVLEKIKEKSKGPGTEKPYTLEPLKTPGGEQRRPKIRV